VTPDQITDEPLALRVAIESIVATIDVAGEAGFIAADPAFTLVETIVVSIGQAIDLAASAGAPRIAGRLRCERPPCEFVWILVVLDDGAVHLLAAERPPRINALGSRAVS
jgi:hypothetical protein